MRELLAIERCVGISDFVPCLRWSPIPQAARCILFLIGYGGLWAGVCCLWRSLISTGSSRHGSLILVSVRLAASGSLILVLANHHRRVRWVVAVVGSVPDRGRPPTRVLVPDRHTSVGQLGSNDNLQARWHWECAAIECSFVGCSLTQR
jgi:hypothetical protein